MCIYCGTVYHRKIYENHFGPIPKDDDGRTYEIHHKDGNNENNDFKNLQCVSINEHYNIHYSQGDWNACLRMSFRMRISVEEKSELGRKHALQQIADGKNVFVGGELQRKVQRKLVSEGKHPFQDPVWKSKTQRKRVTAGTHNWMIRSDGTSLSSDRVKDGSHNFLGGKATLDQIKNGKHASQIKKICEYCDKTLDSANFGRSHGEKCKAKK